MIALNSPLKPDLKKLHKYLERVNDSGWFTNFGPLHNELTERLEDYLGVENLLLVNNGTAALQVAGRALGSESILCTPFSFVATASAFKWQKDELAFADIDRASYNLCPKAVANAYQKGCKADTVVATHVYGNPCDVSALDALKKENNIRIIYDAAHAFGVKLAGNSVLNYGDASTLSFHATKIFHTVEGGAIVFKRSSDFAKAKELINFGMSTGSGTVNLGINAKLNEYQAAVGLVNLEQIDDVLDHRAALFHQYREGLKDAVELQQWHQEANANGAYMPIKLDSTQQLAKVVRALDENGIQSRHYFSPSLDKVFDSSFSYGVENSHEVSEGVLCLPMHAGMSQDDVKAVVENLLASIG
ncbi:MAG: DegT/DnrJ/EryC1/StrS family aminotransferase [Colwellia sp.]